MSKSRNLIHFSLGKNFLTIFVASLIATPSAHARLTAQHSQLWSQDSPGINAAHEVGDRFGGVLTSCDFNGDTFLDLAIGVPYEDINSDQNAGVVHLIYGTSRGLSAIDLQSPIWLSGTSGDPVHKPNDRFGKALASGDMNGDGYCDLAIGAPGRGVGTSNNAGVVYVIYGSVLGLDDAHKQAWNQDTWGIGGNPEAGDSFGSSLAVGDFDGNGKGDLAVGVTGESIGSTDFAGLVQVIYAADDSSGLTARGNQGFNQGDALQSSAEEDDTFGYALATGDFDGNGMDDLVVGVPQEKIGDNTRAGMVHVIYGADDRSGLNVSGNQVWGRGGGGILGVSDVFDHFGYALAVGDFDGNGKDDLAISAPYEKDDNDDVGGVVHVIYGQSGEGLSSLGNQLWSQAGDILGMPESIDLFGIALAVGDFDANHKDDLVVGTMWEDLGEIKDTGVVHVIYGADSGLSSDGNQLWSQNGGEGGDIPGEPERDDQFGEGLAAGDFDGNGQADLAVGAPGRLGGEVSVIYAARSYGSLSLSAASKIVSEGDFVRLTITRTGGSQERVAVRLATTNGSATGEDYTSASIVVPFADGEIQKNVAVATHDDGLIENKESFEVALSDPEGGVSLTPPTSLLIDILDKQSCPAGQKQYEVPAPEIYSGRFYCATAVYIKAGDLSGGDLPVTVVPTGWLMYSAPHIFLYPGFRVELGGELHLGYPIHP